MARKYKTTTLNGRPISTHRKVWILAHGPIPDGCHVHHKNGDKLDNRLENLELLAGGDHVAYHSRGRLAWNRGTAYGKTEAYQRSNQVRRENYLAVCRATLNLYRSGFTQKEVAQQLGISRRQVCDRLRSVRANGDVPD